MGVKLVNTGVTIIDDDSNNEDVNYSSPEYLGNMNPIPDKNNSPKRYIPLVGNLFGKKNLLN